MNFVKSSRPVSILRLPKLSVTRSAAAMMRTGGRRGNQNVGGLTLIVEVWNGTMDIMVQDSSGLMDGILSQGGKYVYPRADWSNSQDQLTESLLLAALC